MSGVLLWVATCGPKENAINSLLTCRYGSGGGSGRFSQRSVVSALSSVFADPSRSSEERVYEVVLKQAALVKKQKKTSLLHDDAFTSPQSVDLSNNADLLNSAYDRCGEVCAEYAKTFYLGTVSYYKISSVLRFII